MPVALFKLDGLVMRYFASTGGTVVTFVSRSIISIRFSTVRACGGTQGSSGIEKMPVARSIRTRRTIFVKKCHFASSATCIPLFAFMI